MSTETVARVATGAPSKAVVPGLARQEARRLLLHPLMVFGFLIYLANGVRAVLADGGPREAFETIDSMLSFYPGIFTIFVASLVATRDRRAGSLEMLEPAPARQYDRVKALIVASLAPALVGMVLVVALHTYFLLDDRFVEAPGVFHLLQPATTIFGGCVLGIMLAVWVPYRGAAVIGAVVIVLANAWLSSMQDGMLFGPMMSWAIWGDFPRDWVGTFPGSPGWHVLYLAGLCGMAASAALVRVADRRTAVVVTGVASVLLAVVAGWGQLP